MKRIADHCAANSAGGDDLSVLNTDAEIISWNNIYMTYRTESTPEFSGHPHPVAHSDLTCERHIPIGKSRIRTISVCLIEEDLNSFKSNRSGCRTFFVLSHDLTASPAESSHDGRIPPAGRHRTGQPLQGTQCVPGQESAHQALPHHHRPEPEPPSAG